MVTEGHIITCLFRQTLFINTSCFHQLKYWNIFWQPIWDNKILFCIYHVLHLARLNLWPTVTGNGGTMFTPLKIIIVQTFFSKSDYTTSRHITKSFLLECFYYLCWKCILKKLKTEGQAKIIIVKFVNALSKKIGDLLSKTIHSTGKWDAYSYHH